MSTRNTVGVASRVLNLRAFYNRSVASAAHFCFPRTLLGIAKDAWTTEFFAQNLTNVIKSTYTSTNQWVPAETIIRPWALGVKFSDKF